MIADRILGADFLYKFQVTVNFKVQCMYTRDENGSRRHQFVTKEMSKAELKEEAPIRGIRNSTTDGDERKSSWNNEKEKETSLGVLVSDIAYDNHRFPSRECDGDSVEKSRGYLQHTTVCTNPTSATLDTRAIQDSNYSKRL